MLKITGGLLFFWLGGGGVPVRSGQVFFCVCFFFFFWGGGVDGHMLGPSLCGREKSPPPWVSTVI